MGVTHCYTMLLRCLTLFNSGGWEGEVTTISTEGIRIDLIPHIYLPIALLMVYCTSIFYACSIQLPVPVVIKNKIKSWLATLPPGI